MTAEYLVSFAAAFGVMTVLGYLIADLLLPRPQFSRRLALALAPALGAGVCSLIGFVFRRPMFTVEGALLVVLCLLWIWRHGLPFSKRRLLLLPQVSISSLIVAGVSGFLLSVLLDRVHKMPHGGWDGWAIWNSHARYLYRDGPNWHLHIQNTFHGDYPLLLPINVSRLWRYAGAEVPDLGGVFAILFAVSGIALLGAFLVELRRKTMATWAAVLLLTTPYFLIAAAYQYADVPLSIYFMATLGLLSLYFADPGKSPGTLVLAGFMAGCAGWMKNEGLLFILAVSVALLLPLVWDRKATLRRYMVFSSGLLAPLAVNIFFKVTIAPPNDLTWNRALPELVEKFWSFDRHAVILTDLGRSFWIFGGWSVHPVVPLLALVVFKGVDWRRLSGPASWTGVVVVGIVLLGYYWVYVLTPMDLRWHLDTSLRRLLMHVWPSFLLLVGAAAVRDAHEESAGVSRGHS